MPVTRPKTSPKSFLASLYIYGKRNFIAANKQAIIREANKGKTRSGKIRATKRTPIMQNPSYVKSITKGTLRKQKHLNVLYLTASPDERAHLRVDAEVRSVQDAIRRSAFRDKVKIEYRPAADLHSLIDGLNDLRPQIIHFSGHGNQTGISTDTGKITKPIAKPLSYDLLGKALAATDRPPQVVFLNSCHSASARKALLPATKVIVAMNDSIDDVTAALFARHFYAAISSGQSVKASFELAKVAIEDASLGSTNIPELIHAPETNPSKIILT